MLWYSLEVPHQVASNQYPIGLDKSEYQVNGFFITQRKHMLWYSLEAPQRGASNEYPQHMFSLRNKKNYSLDTPLTLYLELCKE